MDLTIPQRLAPTHSSAELTLKLCAIADEPTETGNRRRQGAHKNSGAEPPSYRNVGETPLPQGPRYRPAEGRVHDTEYRPGKKCGRLVCHARRKIASNRGDPRDSSS
jgi:hypothetical protein